MPDIKEIEDANKAFWLKMTKASTLPYCREMLRLSADFCSLNPPVERIPDEVCTKGDLTPVREFDENRMAEKFREIEEFIDLMVKIGRKMRRKRIKPAASPFPADILGFIHEHDGEACFEPNHLMCKLGTLRDDNRRITYEFLIEYDILDPITEIYYGVKAVSDDWITSAAFQQEVISDWNKVRENKTYSSLAAKFKMTNNGEDGTFWPFWLRLGECSPAALSEAVANLKKFHAGYKSVLSLRAPAPSRFDTVIDNLLVWQTNDNAYADLLKEIGDRFGTDACALFEEKFISNCLKNNYIRRINATSFCVTEIPNYKFCYLTRLFFLHLSDECSKSSDTQKDGADTCRFGQIPQKLISKVILGNKKRKLTSSDWRKSESDFPDEWLRCENEVKSWLS